MVWQAPHDRHRSVLLHRLGYMVETLSQRAAGGVRPDLAERMVATKGYEDGRVETHFAAKETFMTIDDH